MRMLRKRQVSADVKDHNASGFADGHVSNGVLPASSDDLTDRADCADSFLDRRPK